MSSAFGWTSAWDTIEDDPHFEGEKVYRLEDAEHLPRRIHPEDTFWDANERHLWEVVAVRTKIYRGVVGPHGEEGLDHVFLEPDWTPPNGSSRPGHYIDGAWFPSVEKFTDAIDDGDLIPHRGNGLGPRPPY